jgi:hypothetical protein
MLELETFLETAGTVLGKDDRTERNESQTRTAEHRVMLLALRASMGRPLFL